ASVMSRLDCFVGRSLNIMFVSHPALWKLERFEDFITERRKLIKAKFGYLLSVPTSSAPVQPDAKQT
ncbi:MAG: hypothetical protein KKD12_02930, partial [Proteobacteria bacterium]|nr:hypothetical protein [Pseudomonadota bacterium]